LVGVLKLVMPSMIWEYQLLIFGIGVLTSLLIWRAYLKGKEVTTDVPFLNRRAQQYVGQVFTLQEPIVNGHGKVKVGDTIWRVQGKDMPEGSKVKVIGTDSVTLLVEKLEE
jgi:inner membrane protein